MFSGKKDIKQFLGKYTNITHTYQRVYTKIFNEKKTRKTRLCNRMKRLKNHSETM